MGRGSRDDRFIVHGGQWDGLRSEPKESIHSFLVVDEYNEDGYRIVE